MKLRLFVKFMSYAPLKPVFLTVEGVRCYNDGDKYRYPVFMCNYYIGLANNHAYVALTNVFNITSMVLPTGENPTKTN